MHSAKSNSSPLTAKPFCNSWLAEVSKKTTGLEFANIDELFYFSKLRRIVGSVIQMHQLVRLIFSRSSLSQSAVFQNWLSKSNRKNVFSK